MPENLSFLWPGRIPAFYDIGSKTCYFNTSLTRASKVDDLFVEEVLGHHGFREVLGPERARAFFLSLYRAFKDDPDMPGVIRKYELADVDDYDDLKTEGMTDAQKSEAGEEFGAKLAEESLKPEAQRAPWYRRFVEWFREQFRKLFRMQLSKKAGERASEMFLREAAHRLRRGQVRQSETGAGEGGVRFAPYRRPGAPNSATLRGQLRDTNVPAANGFMQWAHLGGKRLYADYEFLYGKHPEYFSSPEEARAVVEFVLFAPEPAQRVGKISHLSARIRKPEIVGGSK